jgi:hypothetical protein
MTHLQSGLSLPINIYNDKITFMLNGIERKIPDSEYKKIPNNSGFLGGNKSLVDC